MADSNTTTYSFTLPEVGASADSWGTKLNANWDKVDDLLDGSIAVNGITVTGGSIDGTPVGATTPSTGEFTTVTTTGNVDVTGTVQADGLTVENNTTDVSGTIKNTLTGGSRTASLNIIPQNDGAYGLGVQSSGGSGTCTFSFNNKATMKFDLNNDVQFYEDTGTTAKMVWDASAESLGIGTSVLTNNSIITEAHIDNSSTNGVSRLRLSASGENMEGVIAMTGYLGSDSLTFSVGSGGDSSAAERMRIDSAGNVGIGTASPSQKLDVRASSGVVARLSGPNAYNAESGLEFSVGRAKISGFLNGTGGTPGSSLRFFTMPDSGSVTERARIDSSGTLLLNTTTTLTFGDAKFQAKGDTNFWSGTFESSSTVSGRGCVGFVVQNTVAPFARFNHGNNLVGIISTNGSTTNYGTTSDYRLKENVVAMDSASDRVKALKPCRFNFIANPDSIVDGFLAHEAQEVVPEAVTGTKDAVDEDGNPEYQGIDQSKLVPLLTKALQEALAKIEQLETRIETLENN